MEQQPGKIKAEDTQQMMQTYGDESVLDEYGNEEIDMDQLLGDAAAQQAQVEEDRDDDFFDLADDDYGDEGADDMTYSKTADGMHPPRNNPFKTSH